MSNEEYHNPFGSNNNGNQNQNGYYGGESNKRHPADDDGDDEIDLKQLLGVVLRHKWSIAAITLVSGLIAVWYAFSLLLKFGKKLKSHKELFAFGSMKK